MPQFMDVHTGMVGVTPDQLLNHMFEEVTMPRIELSRSDGA